jgi:hypothetical protein
MDKKDEKNTTNESKELVKEAVSSASGDEHTKGKSDKAKETSQKK